MEKTWKTVVILGRCPHSLLLNEQANFVDLMLILAQQKRKVY